MKAAILVNTRSGRGGAELLAESVAGALGAAGIDSQIFALGSSSPRQIVEGARGGRALIVVGGDGTVHAALEPAIEAKLPIYHMPAGTENLFAREFRMRAALPGVVNAVRAGLTASVDLGRVRGRPFAIMCSVGPDAQVIHEVAARRGGSVSRLDFAGPIARVALQGRPSRLSVWVNGHAVIQNRPGLLLIANSRRYALGQDPARRARMDDGLLDIVFLPFEAPGAMLWWMALTRFGLHDRMGGAKYVRGKSVRVESDRPLPLQIDGEAAGFVGAEHGPLEAAIEPGALSVLLPDTS